MLLTALVPADGHWLLVKQALNFNIFCLVYNISTVSNLSLVSVISPCNPQGYPQSVFLIIPKFNPSNMVPCKALSPAVFSLSLYLYFVFFFQYVGTSTTTSLSPFKQYSAFMFMRQRYSTCIVLAESLSLSVSPLHIHLFTYNLTSLCIMSKLGNTTFGFLFQIIDSVRAGGPQTMVPAVPQ